MTKINHHIPEDLLRAYAAGKLPHVFSVVVASHVSICDDCRAGLEAADVLAGAMLDETAPADLSEGALDRLMAALDTAPVAKTVRGSGIFPGPVMEALKGQPPKWKMLGSDCSGQFARGDVETASDDLDHQPVAGMGEACICLAATDAPLRFTTLLPRLMQPFFRI
jgi:putative transcriptional regulator